MHIKGKPEASGCKWFYYFKCHDHSALQGSEYGQTLLTQADPLTGSKRKQEEDKPILDKVKKKKKKNKDLKTQTVSNGAV